MAYCKRSSGLDFKAWTGFVKYGFVKSGFVKHGLLLPIHTLKIVRVYYFFLRRFACFFACSLDAQCSLSYAFELTGKARSRYGQLL